MTGSLSLFLSVILTAEVGFRNLSGHLLAKGSKFQELAKIIQLQQSRNESVWGVGGTLLASENEVFAEKPVPVPLYPP